MLFTINRLCTCALDSRLALALEYPLPTVGAFSFLDARCILSDVFR